MCAYFPPKEAPSAVPALPQKAEEKGLRAPCRRNAFQKSGKYAMIEENFREVIPVPPLTLMIKPASGRCNMRCRYCFYADEMQCRETALFPIMTEAILEKTIRRALRAAEGQLHLYFQGGEPTLAGLAYFEKAVAFTKKYNARGLQVTIGLQTNGLSLSDEMIAFFAREHFLIGVSLDGTAELHNALRPDAGGGPTWEKIRYNIDRLLAAGVQVNILCVVNALTAARPAEVFHALAPYGFLQFIPCLDPLSGAGQDFSLTAEAYEGFLKTLFDLYYDAFQQGKPVSIRHFDNWISMLLGAPPEICSLSGRCGKGPVIEGDGGVYPCDFYVLDEWRLGNIAENSLQGMLGGEKEQAFLQQSHSLPEECRACRWHFLCRNGCRRERTLPDGRTRWCAAHAAFFDYAFERMQKMALQLAAKGPLQK